MHYIVRQALGATCPVESPASTRCYPWYRYLCIVFLHTALMVFTIAFSGRQITSISILGPEPQLVYKANIPTCSLAPRFTAL